MSLYEGAVKKPIMTSLCFLAVAIFGLFSLSKLPVDLYPDIDTNTIMVMTSYQGASDSDIENNVTRPLENTLNSVSNLKHIIQYAIVSENAVIKKNAVVGARPEDIENKEDWGVAVVGDNRTIGEGAVVAPKEMVYEDKEGVN